MKNHENILYGCGIIPVVVLHTADDAVPLGRALEAGGLPVAEITFRTGAAAESIRRMRGEFPEMLVGAGTITSIAMAGEALDAGAEFLVTPGFSRDVVSWCVSKNVPVYPGCTTASEVEAAMNLGLRVVKFFPAEQSGGLARIKALCGPYPMMRFMPTGGIHLENLPEYLAAPQIFACGGSFMVGEALIAEGRWDEVARRAREAVRTAHGFKLERVRLHTDTSGADQSRRLAALLAQSITPRPDGSIVIGENIEVTPGQTDFTGEIIYKTHNLERALRYLAVAGVSQDALVATRDANGTAIRVRLEEKLGEYALTLV